MVIIPSWRGGSLRGQAGIFKQVNEYDATRAGATAVRSVQEYQRRYG
jgi:hypothetical protein